MKSKYLIVLFLVVSISEMKSQMPIEYGEAIMTGINRNVFNPFVSIHPDSATMTMFDVRNRPAPSPNNWFAPKYFHPDWTMGTIDATGVKTNKLGTVFGITMDKYGNIYVTDMTSLALGSGGPGECAGNNPMDGTYALGAFPKGKGGNGAVYKIDKGTGAVSVIANLPNPAVYPVFTPSDVNCKQYTDPYMRSHWYRGGEDPVSGRKVGVGLGNICYDRAHDQLFVTNREDGKIYRLSTSGSILSSFDPFSDDDGLNGHAPLGERIWGIGYYNDKIYFGRWVQEIGTATLNEVWSVALNPTTGDFAAPNSEVFVLSPPFPAGFTGKNGGDGNTWVATPITDIAFSSDGRMLLSERTMMTDFAERGHRGFTYEYTPNGAGGWNSTPREIFTGKWDPNRNAVGGITYGYDTWDATNSESLLSSREKITWTTADAIRVNESTQTIYGIQGTTLAGNTQGDPGWYQNSNVVDYNHRAINPNAENSKGSLGDVEVFRELCEQTVYEICNNGTETLQLTAETGLLNVVWKDSTSNTIIGNGSTIDIVGTEPFLSDGYEAIYYTAKDASGCDWELCCLVRIKTKVCTPSVCSSVVTATPGNCNPANNQYTLTGQVTLTNPPSTGTVTVQIVGGGSQTFTLPQSSPISYSIAGQTADGASHTVNVSISGVSCTSTISYTAPASCGQSCTLSASCTPTPQSSCTPANGGAAVNVTGAQGNLTYVWSSGETTASISGKNAGTYTVTVTDDFLPNCTATCQAVITSTVVLPTAVCTPVANTNCAAPNGSASVTTNATNPTYVWSNTATTAMISNLSAGTYTVTVTNTITGCTNTCSATVTNNIVIPIITCTAVQPTCADPNGGSITTSITAGSSPFSYLWSNGQTGSAATGLSTGTYAVTVTDSNGCSSNCSSILNAPTGCCLISIQATQPPECDDNGTLAIDTDDRLKFSLNATNTGLNTNYLITVNQGTVTPSVGVYGQNIAFTMQPGSVGQGNVIVTITDSQSPSCQSQITINDPGTCSPASVCVIDNPGLKNITCNDNGTPSSAIDDYTTFILNPTGIGNLDGYTVQVLSTGYSITPTLAKYGSDQLFTLKNGSASVKKIIVRLIDNINLDCFIDVEILSPGTCSNCPNPPCAPINVIKN